MREKSEILKDLINTACFLAKQELAFPGYDETESSSNCGNYVELLHAFAEKDQRLPRNLKTSTVFSGLSNRIQNDLFAAVGEEIRNNIIKEINATLFVAVEVHETTIITNYEQIAIYVYR